MEGLGRVEPEMKLLLSVAFPQGEHVGVERVRVPGEVAQELKVDLVMSRPLGR